jgi:hypothetical protein
VEQAKQLLEAYVRERLQADEMELDGLHTLVDNLSRLRES